MHPIAHFKTITQHHNLVMKYCFRLGLYRQGLLHDLSKYSPTEFIRGAKYYQGFRSPNDEERRQNGVTLAWLHHKGRNKHHFEYWIDYRVGEDGKISYAGNPMPMKYIAEMFCDRIAASRTYHGDQYTDADPYDYFEQRKFRAIMHPDTREELEKMLKVLKEQGEEKAFAYVRKRLKETR